MITDDVLIRGDINISNSGVINQIKVHEFKRQLDDFSADISLQENDYFTLDVSGKSININNYFIKINEIYYLENNIFL